jgi:hypothetical protein
MTTNPTRPQNWSMPVKLFVGLGGVAAAFLIFFLYRS